MSITRFLQLGAAGNSAASGFNIENAAYDQKVLNPYSDYGIAGVIGIAFSEDGTRLFFIADNTGTQQIGSYTLSTPWNLQTRTSDNIQFDPGSEETAPRGLAFNNDGTRMFLVGTQAESVIQYSLGTAYDVSTAVYSTQLSPVTEGLLSVAFNSNGTILYIGSTNPRELWQYSLTTPYDVSTAVIPRSELVLARQPYDISFSSDGRKLFLVEGPNQTVVYQYDLSTAWDITSATDSGISFDAAQNLGSTVLNSASSVKFSTNGDFMFICDALATTSPLSGILQYTST